MEQVDAYLVLKLCSWGGTKVTLASREIPLGAPDGCLGYLPVYKTLEALQADWGDVKYAVIRVPTRAAEGDPLQWT